MIVRYWADRRLVRLALGDCNCEATIIYYASYEKSMLAHTHAVHARTHTCPLEDGRDTQPARGELLADNRRQSPVVVLAITPPVVHGAAGGPSPRLVDTNVIIINLDLCYLKSKATPTCDNFGFD